MLTLATCLQTTVAVLGIGFLETGCRIADRDEFVDSSRLDGEEDDSTKQGGEEEDDSTKMCRGEGDDSKWTQVSKRSESMVSAKLGEGVELVEGEDTKKLEDGLELEEAEEDKTMLDDEVDSTKWEEGLELVEGEDTKKLEDGLELEEAVDTTKMEVGEDTIKMEDGEDTTEAVLVVLKRANWVGLALRLVGLL